MPATSSPLRFGIARGYNNAEVKLSIKEFEPVVGFLLIIYRKKILNIWKWAAA
jgi:hypothetical protein